MGFPVITFRWLLICVAEFAGVPFGRSSREPRYRVEFHSVDSPFHPVTFLMVCLSDFRYIFTAGYVIKFLLG
jgi:hypothetical protein